MKDKVLRPAVLFGFGLVLGVVSRMLDIYTQNLGNMFSQMAVWILLGTLISIESRTARRAMLNVLLFCLGMLLTYYVTAAATRGVYSKTFIVGWTAFALCTPVLAWLAYQTKKPGILPKIISAGIVAVSVLSSVVLFDRLRVYDFIIDGVLVYVLFFRKAKRA